MRLMKQMVESGKGKGRPGEGTEVKPQMNENVGTGVKKLYQGTEADACLLRLRPDLTPDLQ